MPSRRPNAAALAICLTILMSWCLGRACPGDEPPQTTLVAAPVVIAPAGHFHLLIDSAGVPYCQPVDIAFDFTRLVAPLPPPQPPVSPPNPPEPNVSPVVLRVRDAASQVASWDDAQSLRIVYDCVADLVHADLLKPAVAFDAVKTATDSVLMASGNGPKWQPWRTAVTQITQELTAKGELTTQPQIVAYLRCVSSGLASAVPESAPKLDAKYGLQVLLSCYEIANRLK